MSSDSLLFVVTATEAGTYTLAADLVASEQTVAHAVEYIVLESGVQTVTLRFDGADIFRSQLNGPYTITSSAPSPTPVCCLILPLPQPALSLQYTVNFTTTGVYTVWLRGYAPDGAGDSVYLALSGQDPLTSTIVTGFAPRTWSWTNSSVQNGAAVIEIATPGYHTLELWQREDGLRLDRILLTMDSDYNPSGNGPPESERISDYDW